MARHFLMAASSLLASLLLSFSAVAADYQPGKHYDVLLAPVPTSNPDKIEVVELFWYGCPHCYSFEPVLHRWTETLPEDVDFQRMPAVFNKRWKVHAQAYYTAEIMGVLDKVHQPLFDALHRDGKRVNDEGALAEFFADQGVDEDKFRETYNSFGVQIRLQQAATRMRGYRASGVPALIVNGRYRVSGGAQGLKVVDYLIAQERKAKASAE